MAIWTRESSAMSTTNQYIKYRVKVTLNSQSVANNTSNVTVQVLIWRTNQGYTTYGSGTCYCKINGTTYTASITTSQKFTYNSDTVVFSKTITVNHNSDGSKRLDIEARIDHNRFNSSPSWQSYNTNLNTIPRTSKVSLSASSQNLGSSITIYTNRASSSFTHVITYKLGKASGTIGSNVGNSVTWTLPNSLANEITTSTSKSGTITCETYSGSTKIGTSSVTFTAIVPNNSTFNPSIGDMTHSEANSTVKNAIGSYVQKHSRLNIGFSGVSVKYGATIKSYKIEFDGKTYNSSSATTEVINGSGNLTIKGTITDSRGRTATKTVTINVLAYSPPKITTLTVFRCDSNGKENPKGEYISVRRAGTGTSLNSKNQLTIVIKTKPRTSSTWTTKDTATTTSGSFDATKVFGGYGITTTYDVRVEVTDKLTKTPVALNRAVSTEQVAMSWGKTGIGVGKIWEEGTLDVGGRTSIHRNAYALRLIGDDHVYMEFYPRGLGEGRKAYIGFSNSNNTNFTIGNQDTGDLRLEANRGNVIANGYQVLNRRLIQCGQINITPTANSPSSVRVYFPVTFPQRPRVVVSAHSGAPYTAVGEVTYNNPTESYVDVVMYRTNSNTTSVSWIAMVDS